MPREPSAQWGGPPGPANKRGPRPPCPRRDSDRVEPKATGDLSAARRWPLLSLTDGRFLQFRAKVGPMAFEKPPRFVEAFDYQPREYRPFVLTFEPPDKPDEILPWAVRS